MKEKKRKKKEKKNEIHAEQPSSFRAAMKKATKPQPGAQILSSKFPHSFPTPLLNAHKALKLSLLMGRVRTRTEGKREKRSRGISGWRRRVKGNKQGGGRRRGESRG